MTTCDKDGGGVKKSWNLCDVIYGWSLIRLISPSFLITILHQECFQNYNKERDLKTLGIDGRTILERILQSLCALWQSADMSQVVVTPFHLPKFFFYINNLKILTTRLNGHWSSSNSPDDLPFPVAIHTRSHQLPFDSCWNVRVLHNLPPNTNLITRHHLELAYQFILSSRHSPGINLQ